MELARQIKKYRMMKHLSQEELAASIYVSRQTISNWENDKSYPDVHSLVLLSDVFEISLDHLIKGDITIMKEKIKSEDIKQLKRQSTIYALWLIACILLFLPLYQLLNYIGLGIWAVIFLATLCMAMKIEKQKKQYDIQTYKEIVAFYEGKQLDTVTKEREIGKRPYQKAMYALLSGLITVLITLLLSFLFH